MGTICSCGSLHLCNMGGSAGEALLVSGPEQLLCSYAAPYDQLASVAVRGKATLL